MKVYIIVSILTRWNCSCRNYQKSLWIMVWNMLAILHNVTTMIISLIELLCIYLSLLFNCMIHHHVVPIDSPCALWVQFQKNKRKSMILPTRGPLLLVASWASSLIQFFWINVSMFLRHLIINLLSRQGSQLVYFPLSQWNDSMLKK